MPAPLPAPDELIRRQEQRMEASLRARFPDLDPQAITRSVRSPRGVIASLLRVQAMGLYEVHQHLRWLSEQLFADTAEKEFLERIAAIDGITRRPATTAIGVAEFAGVAGLIIPAGTELVNFAGAAIVTTAASAPIGVSGVTTAPLAAVSGGASGNQAGGTTLSLTTPVSGLAQQIATLTAGGLAGGADIESDAGLLARYLAARREPAAGGNQYDYPKWVMNAFAAAKVKTLPLWTGPGSVGVCVAMGTAGAPRAPTAPELAAILAEINLRRPVGYADITVLGATLVAQNLTIGISPESAAVRAAITSAHAAFIAAEAEIGGTLFRSRLVEALSSAAGEYRHAITVPASGDFACGATELIIPGVISWVAL